MIQPLNNNQRTALYTGAGLGAGAIAGGIIGYFTKPYMKGNSVTDEFVYKAIDNSVGELVEEQKKLLAGVKQLWETGSIDGISDDMLEQIGEDDNVDLKALSVEERKTFADKFVKEGFEEFGVDNFDDLSKKCLEDVKDGFVERQKKAINAYDNLIFAEGTAPKKMKETLKAHADMFDFDDYFPNMSLDEAIDDAVDGKPVSEVNKFILDKKQQAQEGFNSGINRHKNLINEYLVLKKEGKPGKNLERVFTEDELKVFGKKFDKLVRNAKLKAAGKWAAISGGVLAVIGAGAALLTGKKKA